MPQQDLYNQNGWAYSEAPGATYNVWAEETDSFWATINNHSSYAEGVEYCSNPAYDFHYSPTWIYTTPECRAMAPEQVVRKLDGLLFIMTAFLETVEEGWNCTNPGASTCDAPNTLRELKTGQCVCEHPTKAVYPLAVEELAVKFEHSFKTHASFNDLWRELKGSSSDPSSGLMTRVLDGAGAVVGDEHEPGTSGIGMTLREWLQHADRPVSLDYINVNVSADVRGASDPAYAERYPPLRTTGIAMDVELYYSNLVGGRATPYNSAVDADVRTSVELSAWAGLGGDAEYLVPPDPADPSRYTLARRYGQGAIFRLGAGGKLYVFSYFYLINVLVAGAVGLAFVNKVTDFVTKYMLPGGVSKLMCASSHPAIALPRSRRRSVFFPTPPPSICA